MTYITKKAAVILAVVLVVVIAAVAAYISYVNKELTQTKTLSAEQATNINALQNKLEVSEEQAARLADYISKIQVNQKPPVSYITVTAPTVEKAVDNVQERIEKKDPTLPTALLEKTDRTVVAPQPENEEYKVGVYKINLDKKNRIKAGATYVDDEFYYSLGYERNRIELMAHTKDFRSVKGASVVYTIARW